MTKDQLIVWYGKEGELKEFAEGLWWLENENPDECGLQVRVDDQS